MANVSYITEQLEKQNPARRYCVFG
jgi:hypothetical protein